MNKVSKGINLPLPTAPRRLSLHIYNYWNRCSCKPTSSSQFEPLISGDRNTNPARNASFPAILNIGIHLPHFTIFKRKILVPSHLRLLYKSHHFTKHIIISTSGSHKRKQRRIHNCMARTL